MAEIRKTICNRDCPDACSIVAHVEDGRVTKIGGDPDHPVTQGFLCFRTNRFLERQYSPERLTRPLLRNARGELQPVSWDAALDFAAERLTQIRKESGPAAIFHYRSGGTLGALMHLTDYFFEQFGPVTTKRGDICSGAGDAAQHADFGLEDSNDVYDLRDNSKNILLWGKNVVVSSVHLVPILKEARKRGARMALIDPVHHRTAELCDLFVQPRPGGDFALAMAVARLLFERGHIDADARRYCDHVDEFSALAQKRSVAEWCAEADVPTAQAEDLAARLHERPCAILVGWGMGRRINGSGIVRALDALCALSGNLGIAGGGSSFYFWRRKAFDHTFVKGAKGAPRTVLEPLLGPEVLAMNDPPIRAMWVTAGNPVAMLPESQTTARALASREFLVVADSFLTDTAQLAHLVLPTPTLLETDDLLGAYGHHYVGSARPVVPPPPEVKSDLEIMQGLAARTGLAEVMAGDAQSWKRRILRDGMSLEELDRGAQRSPYSPKVVFQDRKFPTPSGKVNLMTAAPPSESRTPQYPLWLLSLSTDKSQSSQWAIKVEGPPEVTVHPEAANGIPEGALARVESPLGSLRVKVRHDRKQRRDVLLMAKGGHYRDGRCANALIRARATDHGEGGALYDEGVRLVADH